MRRSLLILILILCCSGVLARDPFQPLAGAACQPAAEPLTGWRLQGIVGQGSRFYAWLLTPQGQVRTIRAGQPFALTPWQLIAIDRRSLTLAIKNSCSAQRHSFYLIGSPHENHSDVIAGSQLPVAGLRR